MSDTSTSGATPSGAPAETAGAPIAPAADWGASTGVTRGSGLARGKRVSTPASPAPASNTAASGAYQPSAVQVLKAETEYQNPFASADVAPAAPAPVVAPAPVAAAPVAPVVAPKPAEAPAPAPSAPAAAVVPPVAPAAKAELNILPPAEVKRPAQSWETPAFPYEAKPAAPSASTPVAKSLAGERPLFRPERRSDAPMLDSAPNATGKGAGIPPAPSHRNSRGQGGGNRQQRDNRPRQPQQPRDQKRPANNQLGQQPAPSFNKPAGGQPSSKKPTGLFGWVKGLFGNAAPEAGAPALPGTPPQSQPHAGGGGGGGGERGPEGQQGQRRRRRRGGRGRSGGGGAPQGGPSAPQGGVNPAQSHGQGHPSHGHGGGEHRPQGQGQGGGGRRRSRGGRGRSGGGGGGQGGGQNQGHRHEGGGSGIPPSA